MQDSHSLLWSSLITNHHYKSPLSSSASWHHNDKKPAKTRKGDEEFHWGEKPESIFLVLLFADDQRPFSILALFASRPFVGFFSLLHNWFLLLMLDPLVSHKNYHPAEKTWGKTTTRRNYLQDQSLISQKYWWQCQIYFAWKDLFWKRSLPRRCPWATKPRKGAPVIFVLKSYHN